MIGFTNNEDINSCNFVLKRVYFLSDLITIEGYERKGYSVPNIRFGINKDGNIVNV